MSEVKGYEVSYGNQVLDVLTAVKDDDRRVEMSVRQIAQESALSASAVQIGLSALRREGRLRVRKKGTAGRPSVQELVSEEPLGEAPHTPSTPAVLGDSKLAQAFIERYDELLLQVNRDVSAEVDRLRLRVAELEAENERARSQNSRLHDTVTRLAELVGNGAETASTGGAGDRGR